MAYPLEMRTRVVAAYEAGAETLLEIAETFQIGVATVNRWWSRYLKTGSVARLPPGGGMKPKVDQSGERALRGWLKEQADLTLEELIERYRKHYGVSVGMASMCRTLQRLGLNRKKRPSTLPRGARRG